MGTPFLQQGGPMASSFSPKELQAAISEASLILHCPPDFPKDAEIVGVCAVSDDWKGQNQYAWIIADFLAFKLGFFRVGHRDNQSWLSSINVTEFILENTQGEIPKDGTVQTCILGRENAHIVQISQTSKKVEQELLEHIRRRAQAADQRKTTLVLMFFAPITSDQDVCLDFQSEKIYLTTTKICEAIHDAVGHSDLPVVYMTPSPFTTGWMCRPALMGPMACTIPEALNTIAKSCGAAFADGFMKRLIEKSTPLLNDSERKQARYDTLMPTSATAEQTELLRVFQERIYRSLKQRLSPLALEHAARIEESDAWTEYAARNGRPLSFWAPKFSPMSYTDTNELFGFLGGAFGGTKASQLFHLRYLATLEFDTCPGDWSRGTTGMTSSLLRGLFQLENPSESYVERAFGVLEFRASSITLAQTLAKTLELPLPETQKCRYWHDKITGNDPAYYGKLQAAFGEAHNLFDLIAVNPSEERHDFKVVRFLRASRWLSAAIAHKFEEDGNSNTVKNFVCKELAPRINTIRNAQLRLLLNNQVIHKAGRGWLASIGLCNDTMTVPKKEAGDNKPRAATDTLTTNARSNRVVSSASILNPEAPEYRVLVPTGALEVQTPALENAPLGWTPLPAKTMIDENRKPLATAVLSKDVAAPTPAAIEPLENFKPIHTTRRKNAIEIKKPLEPVQPILSVEQAKTAETANPIEPVKPVEPVDPVFPQGPASSLPRMERPCSVHWTQPIEFVKPIETVEITNSSEPICSAESNQQFVQKFNDSTGINDASNSSLQNEAAKMLSALMGPNVSSKRMAEVLKEAVRLVEKRDGKADAVAGTVNPNNEITVQAGESALVQTEQHDRPQSIDGATPTVDVQTEAEAVINPTPPRSPAIEKMELAAHSPVNCNAGTATIGGLYEGEDFWAKFQQGGRGW